MASPQRGDGGAPPPDSHYTPATPSPGTRPGFQAPARSSTTTSLASTATHCLRSASLRLLDTDLPPGFMAATGETAARMHSLSEIRRGSLGTGNSPTISSVTRHNSDESGPRRFSRTGTGLSAKSKKGKSSSTGETTARGGLKRGEGRLIADGGDCALLGGTSLGALRSVTNESAAEGERTAGADTEHVKEPTDATRTLTAETDDKPVAEYANGYQPPPKLSWSTSTALALKAYWNWVWTIPGFLITLYGLNVVAWGGMLFLLLCNAAPAMCVPSCNDINSPRRVWIETDSQILNALFCVTGFGLAPWRFRDLFWWGVWRLGWYGKASWGATRAERKLYGLRKLAGINRGWFRLPGSEALPPLFPEHLDPQNPEAAAAAAKKKKKSQKKEKKAGKEVDGADDVLVVAEVPAGVDETALPTPLYKTPDPPPTGVRAPPTKLWKMDFVVWCNVWNTFLQACLAGFMWALNRIDRPSWSTGLFVALACIVAAAGGLVIFLEGNAVKKVEGVPMGTWRSEEKELLDEERAVGGREGRIGEEVRESGLKE